MPSWIPLSAWIGAGLIVGVVVLALTAPTVQDELPKLNVAFVGNSITYFNDLPRLVESLSGGLVHQQSCLHGSLGLRTMLRRGNGMYELWHTEQAILEEDYNGSTVYDFGICSIPQLLFGYDNNLDANNENGMYKDDGRNPCLQSEAYSLYLNETYAAPSWDYIVLNDQTQYPALPAKRRKSLYALKEVYVTMFQEVEALQPVFLATHAYALDNRTDVSTDDNVDDDNQGGGDNDNQGGDNDNQDDDDDGTSVLESIPEFTSSVHYGYQIYAEVLAEILPKKPLVAPSGIAFLVVWEESYGLWQRLFYYDGFHPSPLGGYLIGCVLFATIYGRMPLSAIAVPEDLTGLFAPARNMQIKPEYPQQALPTQEEAIYLYSVAERVVLKGYRPPSFLDGAKVAAMEGVDPSTWYNLD